MASSNILNERLITLRQAAKLLPRRRAGRPTHVASLYRWANKGIRGVRLQTVRVGGVVCTSVEAIQRFVREVSQIQPGRCQARPHYLRSPRRRREAALRAERELKRLGL